MSGPVRPMSRAEVQVLLGLIASYDPRADVGDAAVSAWQVALAGCVLGECQAAVIAHAQTSPHRITPADLIARIREARRTRADRQVVRSLAQHDRERAAAAGRRGIVAVYAAMGWERNGDLAAAFDVACPVDGCRALPGAPCRRSGASRTGRPEARDLAARVHPSRAQEARRHAEQANAVRQEVSA